MTSCVECCHSISSDNATSEKPDLKPYPAASFEEAGATEAPFLKIVGGSGTGKTELLIRKALALAQKGANPASILIIVNTADAALACSARLLAANPNASGITVTTLRELCQKILGSSAAQQATGRIPRLLVQAEYNFLLEDLKSLGQQPSQLRELLDQTFCQWSNLELDDVASLSSEENEVRKVLDQHLRLRGAMLAEELSALSANYLSHEETCPAEPAYEAILVDDYQNLSRASQAVCSLLKAETLIVTGNENQAITTCDSFPNPAGFTCFEQSLTRAQCVQLIDNLRCPAPIANMGNALCRYDGLSKYREATALEQAPGPRCEAAASEQPDSPRYKATVSEQTSSPCCEAATSEKTPAAHQQAPGAERPFSPETLQIKWALPEDEFLGLAAYIKHVLTANEDIDASDIYLIAPHKAWALAMKKALDRRRIDSCIALNSQPLIGDPRTTKRAVQLIAYTKLNLLANPHDVVAWRSWCGFGDTLCHSEAWGNLEAWAQSKSLGIFESFDKLTSLPQTPFPGADILTQRYLEGTELIKQHAHKTGFSLVKALGNTQDLANFNTLINPLEGDETAQVLYARAASRVIDPQLGVSPRVLKIGSYEKLQGLNPRILVISGLVDGFMPSHQCFDKTLTEEDRSRNLSANRRLFYQALTKTSGTLVLSTLQKANLKTAEGCKLTVRRTKIEHSESTAMLSPSVFIGQAGETVPGSVSGQQFLSELL